jgi:hypothetical protein
MDGICAICPLSDGGFGLPLVQVSRHLRKVAESKSVCRNGETLFHAPLTTKPLYKAPTRPATCD